MTESSLFLAQADAPVRRRFTADQKRQIVIESLQPGISIAAVARAHDLNANQLHSWRWQYRRGDFSSVVLDDPAQGAASPLLPVCVVRSPAPAASELTTPGSIEIFVGPHRVVLHGAVDASTLRCLLGALVA